MTSYCPLHAISVPLKVCSITAGDELQFSELVG